MAMTGLNRLILGILKPSTAAKAAAEEMGLEFGAAALKANGLGGMLKLIEEATGGDAEKMAQLFPLVQGFRAAATLTKDELVLYNEAMVGMGDSTDRVNRALEDIFKTTSFNADVLSKTWENFKIVLFDVIKGPLNDFILKLTVLVAKLAETDPKILELGLKLLAVAAAAGPVVLLLGGIVTALGFLLTPTGLVVGAVLGLAAAFVASQGSIEGARAKVSEIADALKTKLALAVEAVKLLLDKLMSLWDFAWPWMQSLVSQVLGDVGSFIKRILGDAATFIITTFAGVIAWWNANLPLIEKTVFVVLTKAKEIWTTVWPYLEKVLGAVWENIKTIVRTAIDVVLGIIKTVMLIITGDWEGAWNEVKSILETVWGAVKQVVKTALDTVLGFIGTSSDEIMEIVGFLARKLDEGWGNIFSINLKALKELAGHAVEAMASGLEIGKSLIQGITQGIERFFSSVVTTARGIIAKIKAAMLAEAEAGSPARAFIPIGEYIDQGIAAGLLADLPAVRAAGSQVIADLHSFMLKELRGSELNVLDLAKWGSRVSLGGASAQPPAPLAGSAKYMALSGPDFGPSGVQFNFYNPKIADEDSAKALLTEAARKLRLMGVTA
jgi:hypothetical protein